MKFTFLGTGTSQGVPLIGCDCHVCRSEDPRDKRLRCSLLVESKEATVVIDIGPDFRQQMLRENVKKLDAVVLTHEHMDHLAGLDEVRAFNYFQQKPMKIFATEQVQQRIREQYSYVFESPDYPGIPRLEMVAISDIPFRIGDIDFVPIEVMHGSLPVLCFRMGDFTYITDANFISPEEKAKISGSKYMALNALRRQKHHSHFSLPEAIDLSQELKAERTFLIHISHQMGLHQEVEKELPDGVHLAYDRLSIGL